MAKLNKLNLVKYDSGENLTSQKTNANLGNTQDKINKLIDNNYANETKANANESAIATNKNDIATNKSEIATNKANITTNTSAIATIEQTGTGHASSIGTLQRDVNTNKTNIATNTNAIADEKVKTATLQGKATTLETGVADLVRRMGSLESHVEQDESTTANTIIVKSDYYTTTSAVENDFSALIELNQTYNTSVSPSYSSSGLTMRVVDSNNQTLKQTNLILLNFKNNEWDLIKTQTRLFKEKTYAIRYVKTLAIKDGSTDRTLSNIFILDFSALSSGTAGGTYDDSVLRGLITTNTNSIAVNTAGVSSNDNDIATNTNDISGIKTKNTQQDTAISNRIQFSDLETKLIMNFVMDKTKDTIQKGYSYNSGNKITTLDFNLPTKDIWDELDKKADADFHLRYHQIYELELKNEKYFKLGLTNSADSGDSIENSMSSNVKFSDFSWWNGALTKSGNPIGRDYTFFKEIFDNETNAKNRLIYAFTGMASNLLALDGFFQSNAGGGNTDYIKPVYIDRYKVAYPLDNSSSSLQTLIDGLTTAMVAPTSQTSSGVITAEIINTLKNCDYLETSLYWGTELDTKLQRTYSGFMNEPKKTSNPHSIYMNYRGNVNDFQKDIGGITTSIKIDDLPLFLRITPLKVANSDGKVERYAPFIFKVDFSTSILTRTGGYILSLEQRTMRLDEATTVQAGTNGRIRVVQATHSDANNYQKNFILNVDDMRPTQNNIYPIEKNIWRAGNGINITPNDNSDTMTISATGGGGSVSQAAVYAEDKKIFKSTGNIEFSFTDATSSVVANYKAAAFLASFSSAANSRVAVAGTATKSYDPSTGVLTITGGNPSDYTAEKAKIAQNTSDITTLTNEKVAISGIQNRIRHVYTLDKTTDNSTTTQAYNSTSKITTFTSTIGAKSIAGTVDEDTLYDGLDDILIAGNYITFNKTPNTNRITINTSNEKALIYEGFRAAYLNDNRSNISAIYQAANNTFTLNLNSSLTNKITQNETDVETLKESAFIKNVNDFDSHFTIPNESGVQTKWDNAFFNTIAADANLDTDAKKKKAVVKVMVSGAVLAIKKRLQIIQLGSKISSPNIDKIMRAGINKWIPNFIDESDDAYRYRIILNHSNKIENEKWYQNNQMKGTLSVILEIFKGNPSTTDVRYVIYENSALRPLDGNVVEWREEVKLKADKREIDAIKEEIKDINEQENEDHKAIVESGMISREVNKYPDFRTGTGLSNAYFQGKLRDQSWSSTELFVRSSFEDIINRFRQRKTKTYFLESEVDQDTNVVFYEANASNYFETSGFVSATGDYWLQYWMEDETNPRIWRIYTVSKRGSGDYDFTKGHMMTITGTITSNTFQFNDSNVAEEANKNVSTLGGFVAQRDPVIWQGWKYKWYYQRADNAYEIKTQQEIMRAADALKASYDAYKTSNDIAIGELKAHQGFGDNLVRHDLLEMGVDLANVPFFNNWNTITGMTDAQINTDLLAGRDTWSYWLDKVYNSAYVGNLNTNDYFVFQNVRGRDILLPQLIQGSTILNDIDISNSYQTFKLIFKKQLGGLVIYALGKHHSGYDYTKAVELLFVNSTNAVSKRSYPYNASSIQTALKGYLLSKLLKIKDYDDNIVDFHAYLRDEILYHNAYEVFRTNQVHFSINRKGQVNRTAKPANVWRFPDALDSTIASGVSSHTPNNEIVWNNTTKVATVKRGVYKIGWRQTLYDIDSSGDTATEFVISGTEGTDYYFEPEFDVAEGSFNAGRNSITLKFIIGGIIRVEAASITIAPKYRCPESGARNSGEGHGQASLSNVVQNYFRIKKLNSGTEILNTT